MQGKWSRKKESRKMTKLSEKWVVRIALKGRIQRRYLTGTEMNMIGNQRKDFKQTREREKETVPKYWSKMTWE